MCFNTDFLKFREHDGFLVQLIYQRIINLKKAREKNLIDHSHRPPKRLLLESRAVSDAATMVPTFGLKRFLPQGDMHPVLVFPGFLASSRSTQTLIK